MAPDSGRTLTVGPLTLASSADSVFRVVVNTGGTSSATVTGPAALAGTLQVDLDPAARGTRSYRVLSSAGVTSRFDNVAFAGATPAGYSVAYLPADAPTYVELNILGSAPAVQPIPTLARWGWCC